MHFWTFWTILAWIGTKLGLIYSKSLQGDSTPFLLHQDPVYHFFAGQK